MDELHRITTLKNQVKADIEKAKERLRALDLVEQMLRESSHEQAKTVAVPPRRYRDTSQQDAIVDVLRSAGRRLTASEIADALKRGGFPFTSKNPTNPVYARLKLNPKGTFSKPEKVGGRTTFGLAEWESKETIGTSA